MSTSTTATAPAVATKGVKVVRIWLEGEDRFVSVEVDGQIIHLREGDEV